MAVADECLRDFERLWELPRREQFTLCLLFSPRSSASNRERTLCVFASLRFALLLLRLRYQLWRGAGPAEW